MLGDLFSSTMPSLISGSSPPLHRPASPPRTGNLTLHPKPDRGGARIPTVCQNKLGIHPALAAQFRANGCGGVSNLIDRLL